ncbi:iron-containing redox enzyme family protein, partial [Kitasatospora sp. NPDC057198]|uniref:iron-containing redox enzyme family protein n=1 Tax=Kitasatospora sp. NPDC057198 TaxID=3346046 RepID=UPI003638ED47
SPRGTLFYREHVLADAVHEQLVRHTVIEPLLARPSECPAPEIAFGALAYVRAEDRLAEHLMASWRSGASSLRTPLPDEPDGSAGPGASAVPDVPNAGPGAPGEPEGARR